MPETRCCAWCGILILKSDRPIIVYGASQMPRMIHGDCEPGFAAFSRNV